jgi:hypothetical protein
MRAAPQLHSEYQSHGGSRLAYPPWHIPPGIPPWHTSWAPVASREDLVVSLQLQRASDSHLCQRRCNQRQDLRDHRYGPVGSSFPASWSSSKRMPTTSANSNTQPATTKVTVASPFTAFRCPSALSPSRTRRGPCLARHSSPGPATVRAAPRPRRGRDQRSLQ